jgi:hypothetical protein
MPPSLLRSGCAALLFAVALGWVSDGSAAVVTYPSSQSIWPAGPLPPGGGRGLTYNAAIGEREGGLLVVTGAKSIAVGITAPHGVDLPVRLFYVRFVSAGGRLVPDALEPWDGTARAAQKANQPVLVQVEVPYGTRPGSYAGVLHVTADAKSTSVPLTVKVFPVTLPHPGTRVGNLLTSFHLSPESYVAKAAQLYGFGTNEQRIDANRSLFGLLGAYRISPGSWGFAEPRRAVGYESSSKWWLDSAGNFLGQLGSTPGSPRCASPSRATARRSGTTSPGLVLTNPRSGAITYAACAPSGHSIGRFAPTRSPTCSGSTSQASQVSDSSRVKPPWCIDASPEACSS